MGGTTESVLIAKAIAHIGLDFIVTVASPTAKTLYRSECRVKVGRMDIETMAQFCLKEGIVAILDASHPYAVEVSQNSISTAEVHHIPYLRYERPFVQLSVNSCQLSVIELNSFDALLQGNYLSGKRVLLTIGCQNLHLFKSFHQNSTLFARILPKPESLAMAIAAGFTSDKIIAIRPPLSKELERALWQQWQISLVVTKASGRAGGEDIKREVARELDVPLIVITRPQIIYPQQTDCLDEAIAFCHKHLSG
ncbi:MAG: cobalt-precorrin-6A reductase [Xenococcaceae cyanobacterium MO_188.B32]|nr:cobalt-precorrin-6A reductase [Xenococcaceae cyanobacterium MO_188.B32]